MSISLNLLAPSSGSTCASTRRTLTNQIEPIGRDLLREEHQKCRAYGQHGFDLNRLDHGMIPVVLEQHGRTAPGAQALFQRLMRHRTQTLVRQGIAAYSAAKRQASSELWAPPFLYPAQSSMAVTGGVPTCPNSGQATQQFHPSPTGCD